MELSDIIIDPEFQSLIPPLTEQERADLEASLLADGCVSPLLVWEEQAVLLDGHNRYEICRRNGILCQIHLLSMESRDEAKAWIIRHQLGRRNLNESQRAMLAVALKEVLAKDAKQRQEASQLAGKDKEGNPVRRSVLSNLTGPNAGVARQQAADAMKVSAGLVHAAEKVKTSGSDKLQHAVMSGQASVSAAAEVAKLPADQQDKIVAGGKKEIAQAARTVRQARRIVTKAQYEAEAAAEAGESSLAPLPVKQLIRLRELVTHLRELTERPIMEYSPITIRQCIANIVEIVF